jgi:hypothetical protein
VSDIRTANPNSRKICGIPVPLLFVVYLVSIAAPILGLIILLSQFFSRTAPPVFIVWSLPGELIVGGLASLLIIVALSTVSWFQKSRFSLTEFWIFCMAAGAALALTDTNRMPFYQYSGAVAACGAFAAGIMMSGLLSLWTFSKRLRLTVLALSAIVGSGFGQGITACAVIVGFLVAMPLLGFCVWRREQLPISPGSFSRTTPLQEAMKGKSGLAGQGLRLAGPSESAQE